MPAESLAGDGRGAGLAYLNRRREQLSARAESWRSALAGARAVHAHLSRHAILSRLHAPQSSQLSGNQRPMMLNAAYLLDASDGTSFASQVAVAADAHPELELNLTGPWPPYSFTANDGASQGMERHAAEGAEGAPPTGQHGQWTS